jgi:hypothetical protein
MVGVEVRCLLELAYGGHGILDVSGQQERSNVAQRRSLCRQVQTLRPQHEVAVLCYSPV